jgi:hypothetical protein
MRNSKKTIPMAMRNNRDLRWQAPVSLVAKHRFWLSQMAVFVERPKHPSQEPLREDLHQNYCHYDFERSLSVQRMIGKRKGPTTG